jgi:EAL domain-containing protein (putative c-di-GMP-specific phosphodiesterase class I)/ActR/RegA family two-component response regulator
MNENHNVLLIDDDPTQIAILTAYLSSLRISKITSASDGQKALDLLTSSVHETDVIFTDLSMPNMDGYVFLKHLGDLGFKGQIIIISGHEHVLLESAASLGKMYGLNIAGQIRKPLTKQALDRLLATRKEDTNHNGPRSSDVMSSEAILNGIANDEFIPFYQPKVDLLSGKIVGAEALARWQHPELGLISPATFIPIAEADGSILAISIKIFDHLVIDLAQGGAAWKDKKIAFNLSPQMIRDETLPETLISRLNKAGVSSKNICIEITENGVIDFDHITVEVLSRLRIMGFDLSIDDFGTGAASIANLKMFPYTELKIDQSFIGNVLTDAFSAETVRTSISLARQLGLRIVAEGIETHDILQYVKSRGIDQAQGYLFAKPMPVADVNELFANPMGWMSNPTYTKQSNAA